MYYTIGGELYHHQRLGAKWGVMHGPPYPLDRGAFSTNGKKLKKGTSVMEYLKAKSKKRKQRKTLEKARATKAQNAERRKREAEEADRKRQTEEEHAAARDKAFKSGTAEEVMKYQGEFTAAQLQEVINRLNNEQKLSEMSKKDVKTVSDKIDNIVNKIDKARGWTEKGVSAYNTAAKIFNAFSDESELPIIGTDNKHTKANKELEKKNKELDNAFKKLQNENQKLKNEGESLKNQDQSLKNQQTAMNLLKQLEKSENKNNNQNNKPKTEEKKDTINKDSSVSPATSKTPFEKAAEDHKKATEDALNKIDAAEKKKKKKKK